MNQPKEMLKKMSIEYRSKTSSQLEESLIRYQTRLNILLEQQSNSSEVVKLQNKIFLINQELEQRETRKEI